MAFEIFVNGQARRIEGVAPHVSLLRWLRDEGLTGTKEGCAEGDCGACTVAVLEVDALGKATYRAINSCIAVLPMFAGREVWTVEGLARASEGTIPKLDELHPVQRAMVDRYGSQCGYCTPGFVLSMFEAYYRTDLGPGAERGIADQLHGNLCRCTGYRPIRDALGDALSAERPKEDLFQLRLKQAPAPLQSLKYEAANEEFLRPTSVETLCRILSSRPEAELVCGATEIGVEINKKAKRYRVLVSTEGVPELATVSQKEHGWVIGGAATLTTVEDTVGREIPALAKMLSVFASRQIRSRATVAGNLVTASPIGDLAPVLLALDATVVLTRWNGQISSREVPLDGFFVDYRKTVRKKDEVVTQIRIPTPPASAKRLSDSYKVSKRRELDIAIVAAAFTIDLDAADVVTRARLAYGGVAPTPMRAKKTEEVLVGKRWSPATLQAAFEVLRTEATPIDDARSGKEFRAGLMVSLLDKLFRRESSESQDLPLSFARTPRRPDPDASRALHHESAIGHVTGGALYVDDEAHRRGRMLEIWPVVSPHAHARITRRDATKARAMPGVELVLFAGDIPGENDVGAVRKDETLLANDEVLFAGHMVAVVVGESYEACRAAAEAVEVDYEPLLAILSIEDALVHQTFHTAPHRIARGDAAAALAAAPHTLSFGLSLGGQEHFYLESQAAWAECGDDGDIRVASSTQHPSEIQAVVSHVLHLPRNRVVVTSPRMGGGFGGKETQGNTWAALVALAAWKTKKPVRVQLDRDVDMTLTGKRHPFLGDVRVGYDREGRILALTANLVSDGGWALDLSESILDRALFHIDNAYDVPNVDVTGRVAKTHHVSHTAFRGFGGPQGMLFVEEAIDRVARTLGLSPESVRERNLYRNPTATTHYGQAVVDPRAPRIWQSLLASSRFAARRLEVDAFNVAHEGTKRGLAITPVKFGISFTATYLNQAGALVLAYRDGTVQVNHGGTEMGQGLHTKMRGIVMRELGLPAESVRVMKTTTDKVPNTSATAASAGADLNGAAVRDACETLKGRLAPLRAENPSLTFAQLCEKAHSSQISLAATGYYRTPGIGYDKAAGRGTPFYYFAWGAAVAEVEVDARSGMKRVRRVDILHDVGDSLHPSVDLGQIEGGFVQGMGWLTGEELKWDDRGRLLTHSASTYQIPAISDAPFEMHVELLPAASQPGVIHGSKAVGEPPLMLAISVREAIRDAIGAFGTKGGIVELPSPATHEAIYHSIQARLSQGAVEGREVLMKTAPMNR